MKFSLASLLAVLTLVCVVLAALSTSAHTLRLAETNRQFDVAIIGDAYFQAVDGDGNVFYTRCGEFELNADGALALKGHDVVIEPYLAVPPDAGNVLISCDGRVRVQEPFSDDAIDIGYLQLVAFPDKHCLKRQRGTALLKSVDPQVRGLPITENKARSITLVQGWLERAESTDIYMSRRSVVALACVITALVVVSQSRRLKAAVRSGA